MANALIELENILVCYRKKRVLGPLTLNINRGDFWGIVGPNGAGKTTLMRIIAGLESITEGRGSIFGNYIGPSLKCSQIVIRKKIGILLQHHEYYPDSPFTVEDVVLFGRAGLPGLGRCYRSIDYEVVNTVLKELNLENFRTRLYRELSGGEQRKVQLARLLAQESELILLDEPTAGLDMDWQERLTLLVDELYSNYGKTVVMISHDVDRLPASCNNVLLIHNGHVHEQGTPSEVFTSSFLSHLYGCTIEVTEHHGRYHAYSVGLKEQ